MSDKAKIIYTITDEAPALATHSLLPIIEAYTSAAGVAVETRDISLSGRILANFPDALTAEQRVSDALAELGDLAKAPDANIIKLPNISASVPQMNAAIAELQAKGYALPEYPEVATTDEEKAVKATYDKIKGSAVNPVLREGNSDRRAAGAVKQYAKDNPHRMGAWSADSKSTVASMTAGDFFDNEKSVTIPAATTAKIELIAADGSATVLKDGLALLEGEVLDSTFMSAQALRDFLAGEIAASKAAGILFSLHMKATMMKVSDPIIFGHAVTVFFKDVFDKHAALIAELGVDVKNGFGDLYAKIESLPADKKAEIEADIAAVYASAPDMAMVDSDKGITNLHVPSDVIIDASMPAAIRTSGQMWNLAGHCKTPTSSSLIAAMPASMRRRLNSVRRTARSIQPQWAPCQMLDSWLKRPRSMARTIRHSKSQQLAPFVSQMQQARCCLSTLWSRATSGALAKSRTHRSAIG